MQFSVLLKPYPYQTLGKRIKFIAIYLREHKKNRSNSNISIHLIKHTASDEFFVSAFCSLHICSLFACWFHLNQSLKYDFNTFCPQLFLLQLLCCRFIPIFICSIKSQTLAKHTVISLIRAVSSTKIMITLQHYT